MDRPARVPSIRSDRPEPLAADGAFFADRTDVLAAFVVTLDGRILDANVEFLALCGYNRSDLPALRWTELTPPGYEELDRRMMAECRRRGHTPPFEKEYLRKDGTRLPVLLFATILSGDPRENDAAYLVHAVDLRAVARRGNAGGAQAPEAKARPVEQIVWRSDAAGRNIYYSDAWYDYTGLSAQALQGLNWTAPLHPDDVEPALAAWDQALRHQAPLAVEFRARSRAGAYEWFLAFATALHDETGRVTQFHGTLTNIDEQKRTERESAIFAALSTAIVGARTLPATLDAVARTLVAQGVAEWVTIALLDTDATLRIAAVHHADEAKRLALEGLTGWAAVADGPPFDGPRLTFDPREANVIPDVAALYDRIGYACAISVPLIMNEAIGGTLKVVRSALLPRYGDTDIRFVQSVAARSAAAIASARLYDRERKIATTFQTAVLPQSLPHVPGMRFDARYQAGQEEALVGGDWYDAFRLPDGRCVIAIGDVSGSGLQAATLMAEARQTMRGAAAVNPNPRLMLDAADRVLADREGSRFATAWVGIVDPIDFSLVYGGAGHPAPVLLSPAGEVVRLHAPGLPLGLRDLAERPPNVQCGLEPGTRLVLFTDGLTEYSRDLIGMEAKLESLVGAMPQLGADDVITGVLGSVSAHDDIAVLVVSLDERLCDIGLASVFEWSFDASLARAAHRYRAALSDALAAAGLTARDIAVGETVFAELVGNVVRHAPGQVRVVLDGTGAKPVLHVLDEGPGFHFNARLPLDAMEENGRGLYIVAELAAEFSVSRRPGGGSHARAVLRVSGPASNGRL